MSLFSNDIYFNNGYTEYKNGNYKKAVELYAKAADLGNADATYNLGLMYASGEGVLKDYENRTKNTMKESTEKVLKPFKEDKIIHKRI